MKPNLDNIEIQEPPLQEIKKSRSCLKQTCSTGCGCIVLIIIALILLLKFVAVPREQTLKKIPVNIETTLSIYDHDNVDRITFVSGEKRKQISTFLTYVPKLLLVPAIVALDIDIPTDQTDDVSQWERAYRFVNESEKDTRDSIIIEWKDISTEPDFIEEFYKKELRKKEFTVHSGTKTIKTTEFQFFKKEIEGSLYIEDNPEIKGTDFFSVTLHLPTKK